MAIDTTQERLSIISLGKPYVAQGMHPVGSANRMAAAWIYSGIELASPIVIVYVRAPVTLTFEALSTKMLTFEALSTKMLTFEALSTKELVYQALSTKELVYQALTTKVLTYNA